MVQELTGAPEEVHDRVPGWDTAKAIRALKKMENRSKMEEEMMTRVHLTKEEKKRLKVESCGIAVACQFWPLLSIACSVESMRNFMILLS